MQSNSLRESPQNSTQRSSSQEVEANHMGQNEHTS